MGVLHPHGDSCEQAGSAPTGDDQPMGQRGHSAIQRCITAEMNRKTVSLAEKTTRAGAGAARNNKSGGKVGQNKQTTCKFWNMPQNFCKFMDNSHCTTKRHVCSSCGSKEHGRAQRARCRLPKWQEMMCRQSRTATTAQQLASSSLQCSCTYNIIIVCQTTADE